MFRIVNEAERHLSRPLNDLTLSGRLHNSNGPVSAKEEVSGRPWPLSRTDDRRSAAAGRHAIIVACSTRCFG
jgi:hypothetical protein